LFKIQVRKTPEHASVIPSRRPHRDVGVATYNKLYNHYGSGRPSLDSNDLGHPVIAGDGQSETPCRAPSALDCKCNLKTVSHNFIWHIIQTFTARNRVSLLSIHCGDQHD
jgi:hypothetical protein